MERTASSYNFYSRSLLRPVRSRYLLLTYRLQPKPLPYAIMRQIILTNLPKRAAIFCPARWPCMPYHRSMSSRLKASRSVNSPVQKELVLKFHGMIKVTAIISCEVRLIPRPSTRRPYFHVFNYMYLVFPYPLTILPF